LIKNLKRTKKRNKEVQKKITKNIVASPKQLVVVVMKGRDLPSRDNTTCDPFCTLSIGSITEKTTVARNNEWNVDIKFNFNAINKESDNLEIHLCSDHDKSMVKNDNLGVIILPIREFLKIEKGEKKWYPLVSKTGEKLSGEIMLNIYVKY